MIDYLKDDNLILFNSYTEIKYNFKLIIEPNDNKEKIIQNKPFLFLGKSINCNDSIEFQSNYIGFTILEFLNNYNFIINLCEKYKNKIEKSSEELIVSCNDDGIVDCEIECQNILDNFIEELNTNFDIIHCAPFLINDVHCFSYNFFINVKHYIYDLEKAISELEQQLDINANEILSNRLIELKNQLKEFTKKATFYKIKCIDFITDYKENLLHLYKSFTTTFVPEYQEYQENDYTTYSGNFKRQYKYENENIQLPVANIKLDKKNKKKIIEYCYIISSLKELGEISLYHIMLIEKNVKQCGYCKNYFIPKHNNETYCDRLQRAVKIQQTITPTDNENIIQIEKIKETMTKDNDIIIKNIFQKDKITGKTKFIQQEKMESKENLIQKDTITTLFNANTDSPSNTKTIKKENSIIKLIKNSCKDLGKRQTYQNKNTNCDELFKMLKDRINTRIATCKKYNNKEELKIFTDKKRELENIYNNLLDEYNSTNEKFYKKLHIELTKFDFKYIQEYQTKFTNYKSIKYWDEATKNKLQKKISLY